jgi:mono/diheme cytochrome c family protein
MKSLLVTAGILILCAAGVAVYLWSGSYNVAATDPHWDITHQVLEMVRERSIAAHSKGIEVPSLEDPALIKVGIHEYSTTCVLCHGGPGVVREHYAMGMYPSPPELESGDILKDLSDAQVFWIIQNGLKMTGMPAFGAVHSDEEIWGTVAFMKRLPGMSADEYRSITGGDQPDNGSGHTHEDGDHSH